jgi:hypothetical protein
MFMTLLAIVALLTIGVTVWAFSSSAVQTEKQPHEPTKRRVKAEKSVKAEKNFRVYDEKYSDIDHDR